LSCIKSDTGRVNMPAIHSVDYEAKLITTTWEGEATDVSLYDAFKKYHAFLLNDRTLLGFNEVLNFSDVDLQKLTTQGLIQLTQVAFNIDHDRTQVTRIAIVVNSILAFGMARMYEIYRSFSPKNKKKLRVFREINEALSWIDQKQE